MTEAKTPSNLTLQKVKDYNEYFDIEGKLSDEALGSFGLILKVRLRNDNSNKPYILKLLLRSTFSEKDIVVKGKVLSLLQNKCEDGFVCVYGLYYGKYQGVDYYGLLMELIDGKDLFGLVTSTPGKLPDKTVYKIFYHLTRILYYMHMMNLVHRDIKLENVMISTSPDGSTKITLIDTDDSCSINDNELKCVEQAGTLAYISPSLFDKSLIVAEDFNLLKPGDIWALGVLMYLLINKSFPFNKKGTGSPSFEYMKEVYCGLPRSMKKFNMADQRLSNILNSIFVINDDLRPTAEQLLGQLNSIAGDYE